MQKQKWMLLLLFIPTAVFAFQTSSSQPASYDTVSIEWNWQGGNGQTYQLHTEVDALAIEKEKEDYFRLSYSLSYPLQAIRTFISPRLVYAMEVINRYTPEHETKISSVEQAFKLKDNSLTSQLFWQAYRQYQEDAFSHFQISPCLHPSDNQQPCVRPNYSDLFYHYKASTSPIAKNFQTDRSVEVATIIENVQQWLDTINDTQERVLSFSTPLHALSNNQADSDEKALLLATIISEIAPEYQMFIVYPESSIGSVSPAWLAIDARSGAKGSSILIEDQEHILLSGPIELMSNIMQSNTPLISERLY